MRSTQLIPAFALLVICLPWAIAPARAESEPSIGKVEFSRDVAPLLDRRCACCHVGDRAKAGLKIEDRETVLQYIEPGDPESSPLWSDYLNGESPEHNPATNVMPLCGPIPTKELNIFKVWIEQGANWPEGIKFVSLGGIEKTSSVKSKDNSLFARVSGFIGYFHPAAVHFPIALLMFGGAASALSFLTGGRAVYVAFYCLFWGTLFAVISTVLGWCYAAEKGYPSWDIVPNKESIEAASAVFRHRWLGTFSTSLSVIVCVFAILAVRQPKASWKHIWRIGLIAVALLISIVGHQGGELVYGEILHRAFDRLMGQ
jgi:uncharacterized membrane protein